MTKYMTICGFADAGFADSLLDRSLENGFMAVMPMVGDWQSFLENEITPKGENMELHLRTGRPFGPSYFVEKLEKLIGRRLRPSRGGWPKGKKRK